MMLFEWYKKHEMKFLQKLLLTVSWID
jgi:hypothetical protein